MSSGLIWGQEVYCLEQSEPRQLRRKWVGEAARPQTALQCLVFGVAEGWECPEDDWDSCEVSLFDFRENWRREKGFLLGGGAISKPWPW